MIISGGNLNLFEFAHILPDGATDSIYHMLRAVSHSFADDATLSWYKKCSSIQSVAPEARDTLGSHGGYGDPTKGNWTTLTFSSMLIDIEFINRRFRTISGLSVAVL